MPRRFFSRQPSHLTVVFGVGADIIELAFCANIRRGHSCATTGGGLCATSGPSWALPFSPFLRRVALLGLDMVDMAAKGIADPASLIEAIELAAEVVDRGRR